MAGASRQPPRKLARPCTLERLSPVRDGPQTRQGSRPFRRTSPLPRLPAAAGGGIPQTSSNRLGKAGRRVSNGDIYPTLHPPSGSAGERRLSSAILGCDYRVYTFRNFGREAWPARPGDGTRQRCILWTDGRARPGCRCLGHWCGRPGSNRHSQRETDFKSGVAVVRTAGLEPANPYGRGVLSPLRLPVSPRPHVTRQAVCHRVCHLLRAP